MNPIFDKIPGQERVKQSLTNFLQSKIIPHAFLFTGNVGVGKDNAAIQFAKTLTAKNNSDETEKTIRTIEQLQEPNLKIIFPLPRGKNETDSSSPTEKLNQDEIDLIREQIETKSENPFHKISIPKANLIKINSIRDIKKFLSMNYDETGYRFILISDAHLMNEEAQNALLKNLEEPPENVIFFLTTSMISKLRSTIISRCWRINFDPLTENEIVYVLTDYFKVDKITAEEVAPFAMGSVQSALNLIEVDFHNLKEKTISILRYSFGRKFNSAFEELNSVLSDQASAGYQIIVGMILTWLNDIQKNRLNINRYFFKDHLETLEKFNSKFPEVQLNEISSRLEFLSNLPRNNINPSLLSANLIFELASVVLEQQ
jgi:DNA polymerase-3 subunit delta'